MAFFSKARGILQHTVSKHINREIAASTPSVFQLIRCMSSSKLFIGGLSYNTNETTLRENFEKYGEVIEARIINDRDTGSSRGFGFVTFEDTEAASSAIMALDGKDLEGRQIRVNYANENRARGGYGNYGGGTYGGGGNYGGGSYGGGGNYGSNFGPNNYGAGSSGGGYGTTGPASGGSFGGDGGNYGSGSNYAGSYGTGGSNYATGGGDYGSGGNFVSGNNFGSGNVSYDGVNSQNFGVAGTGGGSDNFFTESSAGSAFNNTGYPYNNSGSSSVGGDKYSNSENIGMANADGAYKQDDQLEANFQDDSEPQDLLDRRAP